MKINRISEKLVEDISNEKIDEILFGLKKISSDFFQGKDDLEKIVSDLSKFSNKKSKNNDQIDDSLVNLGKIINSVSDLLETIDTINQNFESYKSDGRKYIY